MKQQFVRYLALPLIALALMASAPKKSPRFTQCTQIACTPTTNCNVPACGDAGFCGSGHHCIPL